MRHIAYTGDVVYCLSVMAMPISMFVYYALLTIPFQMSVYIRGWCVVQTREHSIMSVYIRGWCVVQTREHSIISVYIRGWCVVQTREHSIIRSFVCVNHGVRVYLSELACNI